MRSISRGTLIRAAAAGLAVCVPLRAADSVVVSLEQALLCMLKHNPLVRVEQLDLDIARHGVRQSAYAFEPTLSGSLDRVWPQGDSAGPPTTASSLALTQPVPTGGSISLGSSVTPSATSGPYVGSAYVSYTQALLQDGGALAGLVPLRRARADLDIRTEELAGFAQRMLRDTERAYWELYLAQHEEVIRQQSLELAQRLLYESQERLKVGRIAPLELVSVQAEVASREKDLIGAQTAVEQKRYQLLYLMADTAEMHWNTQLALVDTPPLPQLPDSVTHHVALALRDRPDLRQARSLARRGHLDVIQTRNGMLPRLDFFLELEGTTPGTTFDNALGTGARHENELTAGLSFSLPASKGSARHRFASARLAERQAQQSVLNLARLVEMEVRSTHAELLKARQQVAAAGSALALQRKRLDAEYEKLAAGASTNYFVLQAQRDLTAAQLDDTRARVASVEAQLELYLKDGSLLQRRGIDPTSL